eukprot:CAMPEP_0115259994 /NCGR_PEP_ID=MMETSP0270-20121206/48109_1 /TAXON_ID=71861 /ORGANISM="Scrippsiella trochoidea, Strain CCMP3099" /LENGTH=223 /DNA_ID=CAMNT_0002675817 /DNA_START=384 /DNA_END=1057 /DNA_ORIENTATION=-
MACAGFSAFWGQPRPAAMQHQAALPLDHSLLSSSSHLYGRDVVKVRDESCGGAVSSSALCLGTDDVDVFDGHARCQCSQHHAALSADQRNRQSSKSTTQSNKPLAMSALSDLSALSLTKLSASSLRSELLEPESLSSLLRRGRTAHAPVQAAPLRLRVGPFTCPGLHAAEGLLGHGHALRGEEPLLFVSQGKRLDIHICSGLGIMGSEEEQEDEEESEAATYA